MSEQVPIPSRVRRFALQSERTDTALMLFPGSTIHGTINIPVSESDVLSEYAIIVHRDYPQFGTLCEVTVVDKSDAKIRAKISGLFRVYVDKSFSDGMSSWTPIIDDDDALKLFTEQQLLQSRAELLVVFVEVVSHYEDDKTALESLRDKLKSAEDNLPKLIDIIAAQLFGYVGHEPTLIPFFYQILSDPDIALRFHLIKFVCVHVVGLLVSHELIGDAFEGEEPTEPHPVDIEGSTNEPSGDDGSEDN